MPMQMPPPGGLPSPMTQPPANAGSMTQQGGNAGNIQSALTKVKAAAKMLEEALPLLPMGSEEHERLAKIVMDLSKGIGKASSNPQQESAALQSAAQNVAKQAPMNDMARMFGAQPQPQGQAA